MKVLACAVLGLVVSLAAGQSVSSPLTTQMGITQNLGGTIPSKVPFKDETGQTVTLANYLGKRPIILLPIFYKCQTGCALITHELLTTLLATEHPTGLKGFFDRGHARHELELGQDLDVVMLSIDPRETPQLAAVKKQVMMDALGDPAAPSYWHLLTGSLDNIRRVTDALGVKYYFNPKLDVIRHPTCSVIISPNGKISSYTIGNDFPTKLLESNLRIAAANRVGMPADQSFMFGCIQLDPQTGARRIVIENVLRLACCLFLFAFGSGIYLMLRNERKQSLPPGGKVRPA
jgi:protein SCO1/2